MDRGNIYLTRHLFPPTVAFPSFTRGATCGDPCLCMADVEVAVGLGWEARPHLRGAHGGSQVPGTGEHGGLSLASTWTSASRAGI